MLQNCDTLSLKSYVQLQTTLKQSYRIFQQYIYTHTKYGIKGSQYWPQKAPAFSGPFSYLEHSCLVPDQE